MAVYDVGMDGKQLYLASELVDGQSLYDLASERREKGQAYSQEDVARIVHDLADALAHAHEGQVIHRDIKPHNIVVDAHGTPKIIDFGLAKLMEDSSSQTVDGTVMGTPAYMAPEQARGAIDQLGPHTDQYGLGATLYWLLTGQTAFSGSHVVVIKSILENPIPLPSTIKPGIDERLEAICMKAMAKHPHDRYASCADMARDLARFLRNEPVAARPVSVFTRLRDWIEARPLEFAMTCACVLFAVVFIYIGQSGYARARAAAVNSKKAQERTAQELARNEEVERQIKQSLADVEAARDRARAAQAKAAEQTAEAQVQADVLQTILEKNKSIEAESRNRRLRAEQARARLEKARLVRSDLLQSNSTAIFDSVRASINKGSFANARSELETVPMKLRNNEWQLLATAARLGGRPAKFEALSFLNFILSYAIDDDLNIIQLNCDKSTIVTVRLDTFEVDTSGQFPEIKQRQKVNVNRPSAYAELYGVRIPLSGFSDIDPKTAKYMAAFVHGEMLFVCRERQLGRFKLDSRQSLEER